MDRFRLHEPLPEADDEPLLDEELLDDVGGSALEVEFPGFPGFEAESAARCETGGPGKVYGAVVS